MLIKKYIIYPIIFITFLIAPIIYSATQPVITQNTVLYPDQNYTQISQTPVALAQKCGPIFAIQNIDGLIQKLPPNYKEEPPSPPGLIPTHGYISDTQLDPQEIKYYPPGTPHITETTILTTMWNNDIVVIWYHPEKITPEETTLLIRLGEENIGDLLILPWMEYENSTSLPQGRSIAYASIGYTQSCEGLNINVLNDFRTYTVLNRTYTLGSTTPQAQFDENNKLPTIHAD